MSDNIWSLITGAVILGVVFMLMRPGSPALQAVTSVSSALTSLVKTATQG